MPTPHPAAFLAGVLALGPAVHPGGVGPQAPEGGAAVYRQTAEFTAAGRPRDLLLHPDSRTLYVGSEDLPGTADVNEGGLHALDPADGRVRSTVGQAPGPTGTLARRAVTRLVRPLPGDGAVFVYPLRGIGTAKDGDAAAAGAWLTGAAVTDAAPGPDPATVLVAQGPLLSEVEVEGAVVKRSVTLEGGDTFAVDAARRTVWFTDVPNRRLYKVNTDTLTVTAGFDLPAGEGFGGFTEVDPETGRVWVGIDNSVVVYGPDGARVATIDGADLPRAAAFDPVTHEAYVVWQDAGDPDQPGSDNNGTFTVYRTGDLKEVATAVSLPGNHAQSGAAAVAVRPGGGTVFVTNPAEGRITELERAVPPKVVQDPADRTVAAGAAVTLTARAEGTPPPTVAWQVSADAGATWRPVAGATGTDHTFTATAADHGHRYRAEFRNDAGTARTAAMTLTVTAQPSGPATGSPTGGSTGGPAAPGPTATPGATADPGASTSGTATNGGTSTAGGAVAGGTGTTSTTTGAVTNGATTAGTTPGPASALAATGAAVLPLGAASAALTATGWLLVRRRRAARDS
ncbi:hypothetical protein [Streptomyces sp. NPDC090022]|uniref:hypothetical protein n=1 Tax=Streptomyces sp. NPDC090022 TaxID=3365920 RepID=UPI0038030DBD